MWTAINKKVVTISNFSKKLLTSTVLWTIKTVKVSYTGEPKTPYQYYNVSNLKLPISIQIEKKSWISQQLRDVEIFVKPKKKFVLTTAFAQKKLSSIISIRTKVKKFAKKCKQKIFRHAEYESARRDLNFLWDKSLSY